MYLSFFMNRKTTWRCFFVTSRRKTWFDEIEIERDIHEILSERKKRDGRTDFFKSFQKKIMKEEKNFILPNWNRIETTSTTT